MSVAWSEVFRQRLATDPDALPWNHLYDVLDDDQAVVDRLRVCAEASLSAEGYRLLWYHSTRKAQRDAQARARTIERVCRELTDLQTRLPAPRTRFRDRSKVEAAVAEILQHGDAARWVTVHIEQVPREEFKQATRGRPGKDTPYVKQIRMRYRITWELDATNIQQDELTDGVFPLITNQQGT